ncbi:hypothetical protein AB5N19_08694 [Seiridium cardinale]|uniref:Rhodopsin domain-containing protein n=1 Tax=Seiridium cardinale TaxID=138064 RepID=A0ABR2XP13_9PEZI
MAGEQRLVDLLGIYDNLHEPTPSWNKSSTIIPSIIVFLVVTWICVIFRIYTRFRILYSPGWDDLFVVLTLLSGTGGSICICFATQHGFGQHFILLNSDQWETYLKLFYVANATYSMSTALVKLALLFQYLRIYRENPLRIFCIIVAIFTALWGIAYTFMALFPCFPPRGYWTLEATATCYGYGAATADSFYATYASASAINMVLDVVILAIPIPLYFRKGTTSRTKMGLLGLLFMGGLVNFLSIWRVATIVDHRAATSPTFDPTWYGPISILLATLEVDVSTICASVPVFWPVLTSKMDKILVTQEIKIERAHRFSTIDDEYEMQRGTGGEGPLFGAHSRGTSESSLHRAESKGVQTTTKDAHYKDRYIMAQVDPLSDRGGRVESEITAVKK